MLVIGRRPGPGLYLANLPGVQINEQPRFDDYNYFPSCSWWVAINER